MTMQIMSEAEAGEATKIKAIVEHELQEAAHEGRLPALLREGFDIEFGEDWQGIPAVWVWLPVAEPSEPDAANISGVSALTFQPHRQLLSADLHHWSFVDVRASS